MEEQREKVKGKSVEEMAQVLGEVDQLLAKHNMRISVASGMCFDTDGYGNIKVQLSVVQNQWRNKEGG
jgi:hypothetical protein